MGRPTAKRPAPQLPIGVVGSGVAHRWDDANDIETRFRMVREAGVFDYYDRSPLPGEVDAYLRGSAATGIPIRAGGFYYALGRDEPLFEWHLRVAAICGAKVHNVQVMANDANGRPVTDDEVVAFYLRAAEAGERHGVTPCFEVHVNMWSEHFGRVAKVGREVERRGVEFNITLDHSHVIFKIDNPREQEVQGMRADVEAGSLILDPYRPGNVVDEWIVANWVRHAHARATIPANPVNVWARHPDGSYGRGIQYPFVRPAPGEWHGDWDEAKLEPWKEVVRKLMRHHATCAESRLGQISTEFIPPPDYGGGAKYSIFAQNIACARWLRATWEATWGETADDGT
ncbi:MAG: hypothetical protein IT518_25795 [Burkholderiales bacterium]|nr:hypothetical protein [Burkholderiales bacterium]